MRNAVKIEVDGTVHGIDLGVDSHEEYEILSRSVGGMIQCVPLGESGLSVWCNDEGKLIGLPYNEKATALWVKHWGNTDIMVGNVVVTGGFNDEGETIGLTPEQVIEIDKAVNHV